jgi:hypothetical protein
VTSAESLKNLKAAAPAGAGAFAIVAAIVVGSIIAPRPAPPGALPLAAAPQPAPSDAITSDATSSAAPIMPEPGSAVPGVQFAQGAPASAPNQAMEIVVKFKDDAKVKDIVDTFWKNAPAAKAKFEAFKKGRPEMADIVLDRVTYSNELVLVHKGGAVPPAQRLSAMRDIARRLGAASDISYAEPNMTAHPGGQ